MQAGHIGHQWIGLALVRAARKAFDVPFVILRQLLGEVVVPVDQWRLPEDSIDPLCTAGEMG
jgi:hypothetical protein